MQETRVQSLGQEDPLEEEKQPVLVFLPGKSQGQRSLAGSQRVRHNWNTQAHTHSQCNGYKHVMPLNLSSLSIFYPELS